MKRNYDRDKLWLRIRRKLYLHANGATTNFDTKTRQLKSDGTTPVNRHRDIAELEQDWTHARSTSKKDKVLWDALTFLFIDSPPAYKLAALPHMPTEVRDMLRYQVVKQSRDTLEWKQAIAFCRHPETGKRRSARVTADLFGISLRTVFNYRKEYAGT